MKTNLRIATAIAATLTTAASLGTGIASRADTPLQQANNASNQAEVGCLHFKGGPHHSYMQDPGRNPHFPHPTNTFSTGPVPISVGETGDVGDGLTVPTPSCPGVTYELRVVSTDGSSLQLQSVTASPTANGPASVSDKGSEVDIDWAGDGQTSDFSASVTTGWKYSPSAGQCIDTYFHVLVTGQEVTSPSGAAVHHDCVQDGSGGGFSYTG